MPRSPADQPETIYRLSILNIDGTADPALEPALPDHDLRMLHRAMLLGRRFDEQLVRLQRQGRVGTFAPIRGHEALSVGSIYALGPTDWVVPYYRETPGLLLRGWPLENFVLYFAGYAEGMRVPEHLRDLPLCLPIASQLPHAVGLAYAARYRREDSVVLVFLGDGATSHGDCHEAMNNAAVYQVPLVFCCANNQWAISLPVAKQTRISTLARRALAYGMPGIQVDGNDLLAVYVATREAVDRARAGGGPTFIEGLTYRSGPHSTADDPTKYRAEDEVRSREAEDPLVRFRRYLEGKGLLDGAGHAALETELQGEIRDAVARAEARMAIDPVEIFVHVYAEMPPELRAQRDELTHDLSTPRQVGDR
jgi:pyruvate dehydrogenase E1 component alpha subunit